MPREWSSGGRNRRWHAANLGGPWRYNGCGIFKNGCKLVCEVHDFNILSITCLCRILGNRAEVGTNGCHRKASSMIDARKSLEASGFSRIGIRLFFESKHNRNSLLVFDDFRMAFCKVFGIFVDTVITGGDVYEGQDCLVVKVVD